MIDSCCASSSESAACGAVEGRAPWSGRRTVNGVVEGVEERCVGACEAACRVSASANETSGWEMAFVNDAAFEVENVSASVIERDAAEEAVHTMFSVLIKHIFCRRRSRRC